MRLTFEQLRAMSREDLVAEFDREAKNVELDLNFLAAEIARRDADALAQEMVGINREMRTLTRVITGLTAVAAVAAIAAVIVASNAS
jgi:hypothetical protein